MQSIEHLEVIGGNMANIVCEIHLLINMLCFFQLSGEIKNQFPSQRINFEIEKKIKIIRKKYDITIYGTYVKQDKVTIILKKKKKLKKLNSFK